jgi:prepilin-type N-terminal cleavage/methylation domain-containing protein
MRKGLTLAEVLIVVVIVGILAAIALPKFSSSGEKTKANQAFAYLRVIRAAEQMYFAKNGTYKVCADKAALKANLGAEVTTENYTFKVEAGDTGIGDSFIATATRVGGKIKIMLCAGGVFTATDLPGYITLPEG